MTEEKGSGSIKEKIYLWAKKRVGYLLTLPAIVSVGIMAVGLFYFSLISFFKYDIIQIFVPAFTLENYLRVFTTEGVVSSFIRTFTLTTITCILCLLIGIPYAYFMVRTKSLMLKRALLLMTLVPFFIGEIVKAYSWVIILGEKGLLGSVTQQLFHSPISLVNTPYAVLIGLLHMLLPMTILLIAPSVTAVSEYTEMAAQNLGATPRQCFFHVVLPQLKPGILGALIVTFAIGATEYANPDLLGGGVFDFVANVMYMMIFNAVNYPYGAAMGVVLVITLSAIVYIILRIGKIGNIFIRGR